MATFSYSHTTPPTHSVIGTERTSLVNIALWLLAALPPLVNYHFYSGVSQ